MRTLDLGLDTDGRSYDDRISHDKIHVSRSTFLNGLASRVHRWFRLTPSFGPELVHEMIDRLDVGRGELILDPFAGAGTTLIEAKLEGRQAIGFEINPLLHFVNEVSLNWGPSDKLISKEVTRISKEFDKYRSIVFEQLAESGLVVPPIHNPTRWWRPDVLARMLVLKRSILATRDPEVRSFLLLAFAGVLVPDLSNVTLGRLQLHFINRDKADINVLDIFLRHVATMQADLRELQEMPEVGKATCTLQNSVELSNLKLARPIDAVITSPPYPNRYSYVWNTRPHLYMLDFFTNSKAAADLDKLTIGGTWGSATSELDKRRIVAVNKAVENAVEPVVAKIRQQDTLMANYVMHYFNRLALHLLGLDPHLAKTARLAYVVGNSWIKDVYVETDVLLAEIIEQLELGFRVSNVHRFRKRNSGVQLFETIVYARKR